MSRAKILVWLEESLIRYPEKIFIYRPHPSENQADNVLALANKYNNFRIIADFGVKQWIKCCDKITTWYSTSVAEIYFANKSCCILRPIEIPYEFDVSVYDGANFIRDLESFFKFLENDAYTFPVNPEVIKKYYDVNNSQPTYIRLCDLLEDILSTNKYDMPELRLHSKMYFLFHKWFYGIAFDIKLLLSRLDYKKILFQNKYLISKVEKQIAVMHRLSADKFKNMAKKEEIFEMENIINYSIRRKI